MALVYVLYKYALYRHVALIFIGRTTQKAVPSVFDVYIQFIISNK